MEQKEKLELVGWVKKSKSGKCYVIQSGKETLGFVNVIQFENMNTGKKKAAPINKFSNTTTK